MGNFFFLVCVFPFEFVLLLRLYNKCMRRKYNFFFNRISRLRCKDSATDTCSGRLTERRLTYGNKFIIKCINVKGTSCQFSPCRLVLVSCRVKNLERLLRVLFGHVTSRGRFKKKTSCVSIVFSSHVTVVTLFSFSSDNKTRSGCRQRLRFLFDRTDFN